MMIKTFLDGLQLPVNPLDDLTFTVSSNNKTYEIVGLGDVMTLGNRKLVEVEIESLFPDPAGGYGFMALPNARQPIEYVNYIQGKINARQPVRLILTGPKTDINMLCAISSFKHRQTAGEEGEYYYALSLKEYREPQIKRVVRQAAASATAAPVPQRTEEPQASGSYTVRKGDCLYNIAKAQYGAGGDWRKIYEANKNIISNPNLIYPDQVLIIP